MSRRLPGMRLPRISISGPGKFLPWNRIAGPAVILLVAAVATAPQLLRGNTCGHDFDFHLVSWFDALHSWRQGVFFPHWAPSANFGAGEPRFVFYPPLSWMLGAALGAMLDWHRVPIVLTFLVLAATGLATRALARQAMPDAPSTLAGCAALFSGYSLFTAYERSAFGEFTGGFWIPLLLLLMLRDRNPSASTWRRAFDGSATLLALVIAGAWLSDVPLGVMASYLLAAFALLLAWLWRSWAPVLRASAGVVLGIGLSALYLLPAAVEQSWVNIREATSDPGLSLENSWLFARHANPALELHDVELFKASAIAVTMIALALAGLLFCWRRNSLPGKLRWWMPLALIPLTVLFLQLPVSDFAWRALPRLRFLQFPWRWLVVVEAPMGIFFAAAVWSARRRWRLAVLAACVCASIAVTAATAQGLLFFQDCDDEDAVSSMMETYEAGTGFEGADEYAPPQADNALLSMDLPQACLSASPTTVLGQGPADTDLDWSPAQGSCDATFPAAPSPERPTAEHLRIDAVASHPGYLILRLRSYPAWQVKVNGQVLHSLPERDDGLMAIPVPKGPLNLSVDWTTTGDVLAGRWLSLMAFALLALLCAVERKVTPPRV